MPKVGRPRACPPPVQDRISQLRAAGYGYRRISRELWTAGISASPWSVRRVILGLPPYDSDPFYADVDVRNRQACTGKVATLDGNGHTFDEIARPA